jgi:hypothetical protein
MTINDIINGRYQGQGITPKNIKKFKKHTAQYFLNDFSRHRGILLEKSVLLSASKADCETNVDANQV